MVAEVSLYYFNGLANKLSSSGLDMREFEPRDAQVERIGFPNPVMWDDTNGWQVINDGGY